MGHYAYKDSVLSYLMLDKDRFGITMLHPTAQNGIVWENNWDNAIKRTVNSAGIDKRNSDPNDKMVSLHCPSHSSQGNQLIVYGNGTAKLRGQHPRLYINKANWEPLWLNTEMTCYAQFIKPLVMSQSYTTFRLCSRSNHQGEYKCVCNGKGYAHEFNIYQNSMTIKDSRFRKELLHPHYANMKTAAAKGFDARKWIGQKFICRNDAKDNVVIQAYVDYSDGYNGGDWKQIGQYIDEGVNWGITEDKELQGIEKDCLKCKGDSDCVDPAPAKPYNEKITRKGASCYLRTDFVSDCYFKKFSIREIA